MQNANLPVHIQYHPERFMAKITKHFFPRLIPRGAMACLHGATLTGPCGVYQYDFGEARHPHEKISTPPESHHRRTMASILRLFSAIEQVKNYILALSTLALRISIVYGLQESGRGYPGLSMFKTGARWDTCCATVQHSLSTTFASSAAWWASITLMWPPEVGNTSKTTLEVSHPLLHLLDPCS